MEVQALLQHTPMAPDLVAHLVAGACGQQTGPWLLNFLPELFLLLQVPGWIWLQLPGPPADLSIAEVGRQGETGEHLGERQLWVPA